MTTYFFHPSLLLGMGWVKIRIRDKHPGSATLAATVPYLYSDVACSVAAAPIGKVELLGRDVEQVAELVVRTLHRQQVGGAGGVWLPRGRGKVQHLFTGPRLHAAMRRRYS